MTLDPHADRPLFRQLADVIRNDIKSGRLAPGVKLRSLHQLAAEHEVGVATVEEALAVLRAEGLIRTQKGRGSFVVEPVDQVEVEINGEAWVSARMPDPAEARELGIPATGVPVLIVEEGDDVRLLAADGHKVHFRPGQK
ncbi:GntR family transcriptional regulator [Nonomuraea sp. NPDC050394]|uniref:GntR family transcriptional regulator n=1 Tax=Nonomuraea sp. NPDC050394 TaxID=3364363 RepID=UPI003794FF10